MFWIIAAVLTVIALLIVVFPMIRIQETNELTREAQNIAIAKQKLASLKKQKDDNDITNEQYLSHKEELENALAIDLEIEQSTTNDTGGRWLIYFLVLVLPIASIATYFKVGEPELLDPQAKLAELKASQTDLSNLSVEEMVDLIKQRLNKNPNDGEGWFMLGRTFMTLQRYPEAVTAYQRSIELVGEEPNILLSLADAMAMKNNGSMLGEPEALVQKVIELEPNNAIALWLGGLAAEQKGDVKVAYKLWGELLPLVSNDPQSANEIKSLLSQLKSNNPDLPELPFNTEVAQTRSITLAVSLDSSLMNELSGNEQVFIYAKASNGPPAPLAARKFKVSDLPLQVTLSDADAMIPQFNLSSVDSITVGARVSISGNPVAQNGDLFVEVYSVKNNSPKEAINLLINQKVTK